MKVIKILTAVLLIGSFSASTFAAACDEKGTGASSSTKIIKEGADKKVDPKVLRD